MASELRSFVFAVSFILLFATLITTIPIGFQGQGTIGDTVTPVNPDLLTGFSDSEGWNTTDFEPFFTLEIYEYDELGGKDWVCSTDFDTTTGFTLLAKVYWFGLWLGQFEAIKFISPTGVDSSYSVTFDEMETDSDEDGTVSYSLISGTTGNWVGDFIFYWNVTTYPDPSDAWDNDTLYFLHGVGLTVNTDVGSLLISLLLLQLPDVPILVSVLLVIPIWASIVFVLWFIIKEMIPFLG